MTMQNSTSDKPTSSDVARYRANYLSEQEGAYLYTKLAEAESDAHLAGLYQRLAGLLAGAFSMSIGEWVSVQSARELNLHQIAIESQQLIIFTNGFTAVVISLMLSVFGLFGIGAGVSLTASSPLWKSGGRQVFLGLLAACIIFGRGRLIGSAVG